MTQSNAKTRGRCPVIANEAGFAWGIGRQGVDMVSGHVVTPASEGYRHAIEGRLNTIWKGIPECLIVQIDVQIG
jgi:hypothetical protein